MRTPRKETYKVNVNKNIIALLNLLQDKDNFRLLLEHDDAMVKNEAQVEISTACEKEIVIIKANSSLWDTAYGCTHYHPD